MKAWLTSGSIDHPGPGSAELTRAFVARRREKNRSLDSLVDGQSLPHHKTPKPSTNPRQLLDSGRPDSLEDCRFYKLHANLPSTQAAGSSPAGRIIDFILLPDRGRRRTVCSNRE